MRARTEKLVRSFLNFDLTRITDRDLRFSLIACDLPRDANVLDAVFSQDVSELFLITAPNHDCKDVVRVRLLEIQERGLTLAVFGESRADNLAADGRSFSDVVLCLSS